MYHGVGKFTDRLGAVPLDLGRRLLAAGTVVPGEVRRALFDAIRTEKPFPRALADSSAAARALLTNALREGEHPALRGVAPDAELCALLPPGMAARLLAVPVRRDGRTGTVDVAVVDPIDSHLGAEIAFHLGGKVRLIAAPLAELERALLLLPARFQRTKTADFEAAPPAPPPPPARPPEIRALIQPVSQPHDDAVPLVRRAGSSNSMPPPRPPSEPPEAIPLSRARVSMTSPTTTPIERPDERPSERADSAPPLQMIVDFRRASRAERSELEPIRAEQPLEHRPVKRKLEPKRPPFSSLTKVLESIDAAGDRAALIEAILRGLLTTSVAAALFAPRKGRFVGVGAIGDVEPELIRRATVPPTGAVADAIAKNERLGTLDPAHDAELYGALGLDRFSSVHVLIRAAFVADRAALLLVSFGLGDVLESTRRARVLSTSAAAAMERMIRK